MEKFVRFSGRVIVAHVVTYIGVGVLAYVFLTHQFFEPEGLAAQVMRTPADPHLWSHVTRWMLPAQVLRGLLIALVLFPFVPTLLAWGYWKRAAALAGLYVVLGQWASTVAGSGTIEVSSRRCSVVSPALDSSESFCACKRVRKNSSCLSFMYSDSGMASSSASVSS